MRQGQDQVCCGYIYICVQEEEAKTWEGFIEEINIWTRLATAIEQKYHANTSY